MEDYDNAVSYVNDNITGSHKARHLEGIIGSMFITSGGSATNIDRALKIWDELPYGNRDLATELIARNMAQVDIATAVAWAEELSEEDVSDAYSGLIYGSIDDHLWILSNASSDALKQRSLARLVGAEYMDRDGSIDASLERLNSLVEQASLTASNGIITMLRERVLSEWARMG